MATMKEVVVTAKLLEGYKVETHSRHHVSIVDQPPAGGGTDAGPSPLDYLFVSLAGCLATIGRIVARQKRLPLRGIDIEIKGIVDTEVLMGKSKENRAGFSKITVNVKVDGDMTQAEKEAFVQEVDERCPISDNIINLTPVEFVVE